MSAAYLAAGGLGEPEGPLVHERVLDGKVAWVIEHGDHVAAGRSSRRGGGVLISDRGVLDGSHVGWCNELKAWGRRFKIQRASRKMRQDRLQSGKCGEVEVKIKRSLGAWIRFE